MRNAVDNARRVFVFGTGQYSQQLVPLLKETGNWNKVECYIDNNKDKTGSVFNGLEIKTLYDVKIAIGSQDIVIIAVKFCEPIIAQLEREGIPESQYLTIDAYIDLVSESVIEEMCCDNCFQNNSKPIRVGFLAQAIQSFDKMASVYFAMSESETYETVLCVVPEFDRTTCLIKDESQIGLFHSRYGHIGLIVAVSHNIDVEKLDLDYVFTSNPYDELFPESLRSRTIMRYTRLCYIPYGYNGAYNFLQTNMAGCRGFYRNVHMVFADNDETEIMLRGYFEDSIKRGNRKIFSIGYPSLERYASEEHRMPESPVVCWTPRWTYDSVAGGSNFFEYFTTICKLNSLFSLRQLMIRPHPLMFEEFRRAGYLTEEEEGKYREYMKTMGIELDENRTVEEMTYSTDILITDFSSIMMQFFMTGRPIIYCHKDIFNLNKDYQKMVDGLYVARSKAEIIAAMEDIVKRGDPKKELRLKIRDQFIQKAKGATQRILDAVKDDYFNATL